MKWNIFGLILGLVLSYLFMTSDYVEAFKKEWQSNKQHERK